MRIFYKPSDQKPTIDELLLRYRQMQFENLVKAIDVPLEILKIDKSYHCINTECFPFLRDNCELFSRYVIANDVYKTNTKWLRQNVKKEQNKPLSRNKWDKNFGKPRYFCASYAMLPVQKGKTCDFFIQKTEKSNEN